MLRQAGRIPSLPQLRASLVPLPPSSSPCLPTAATFKAAGLPPTLQPLRQRGLGEACSCPRTPSQLRRQTGGQDSALSDFNDTSHFPVLQGLQVEQALLVVDRLSD